MKANQRSGVGLRGLAIGLTVAVLVGGAAGIVYEGHKWEYQTVAGTSKLGDLADAGDGQKLDLKTIIHEDEKGVVLLDVKNSGGEVVGSGFLYNNQGDIITNAHVVGDATHAEVKLGDSTVYQGTVIGRSDDTDIALVRVPELAGQQPLAINAAKPAEVGDKVIAFGSPLGLEDTVTTGMISGLQRDFTIKPYNYKDMYQISAPITHGNSGGPLVSEKTGEVLGVNTAGTGDGNIGFSIPIAQVLPLVQNWSANPSSVATITSSDSTTKEANQLQADPSTYKTSAIQMVRYFYDNIDARDFVTAYQVMGSDWQAQLPFDSFQQGYSNTMSVSITEATADDPVDGKVTVTVLLQAVDRLSTGENQVSHFKATYVVGFENSKMRLLSGDAEKVT